MPNDVYLAMNYELILKNICKHVHLEEEEINLLLSLIKWKNILKKNMLLKQVKLVSTSITSIADLLEHFI